MNVADAIQTATRTLAEAGVAEPAKEARSLLAFALTRETSFLIAHPEYELTEKEKRHDSEKIKLGPGAW